LFGPMCGSGTGGQVCRKHGRRAVLDDEEPGYVEMTRDRMAKFEPEEPRVRTQSAPEGDDGGDADGGEKVRRELVIACGDAPEVLQPAEGGLDAPSVAVAALVMADRLLPVPPPGDDRDGSGLAKGPAQGVCVVAAVGDQALRGPAAGEQRVGHADVGGVARRELQRDRTAENVGQRVDLGGLAAPRAADGLRLGPPFPPCAERCAFT